MHEFEVPAMKQSPDSTLAARVRRWASAALTATVSAALAVVLVACGGSGTTPNTGVQTQNLRPLSADFTTRKAVNYSPFRSSNRDTEVITKTMIKQDLDLLVAGGFGMIRLFDSSDMVARQTLEVIRDNSLDLKVYLGAFLQGYGNSTSSFNDAEVARTIALANQFSAIVVAVSVGNEMLIFDFNKIVPATLATYITKVRNAINQPVTTDDNYGYWKVAGPEIVDVIDFVALHTYPQLDTYYAPGLWDWQQLGVEDPTARAAAMMDAALATAQAQYNVARAQLDRIGKSDLPIVIGETGWKALGTGSGDGYMPFRIHPANQKMYVDRLSRWEADARTGADGPRTIFVFEAFDEPWKGDDNGFGLFTVDRKARCAVQAVNANNTPAGSATWVWDTSLGCAETDALYFQKLVPPIAIDADRFTIFADVSVAGEVVQAGGDWAAFGKANGVTADRPIISGTYAPGDASESLHIIPTPADYGWGILRYGPANNLSAFAGGSLTAWINTTAYPGKIEIGFGTDTEDRLGTEVFLQIAPGDYGFCTTGAWCKVTIPIADFLAANPKLDLRAVLRPFVIADRYSFTGKPLNTTGLPSLYVDDIYWSK
jgi:exo-beta-1,3-glucanase (GH17 family)